MELKFKRLNDKAIMPIRAHKSDAGLDLTCTEIVPVRNACNQLLLEYHTGLAVEIPEGYVGLLFPRSSVFKTSLIQSNCVGVIDSGYRERLKQSLETLQMLFLQYFKKVKDSVNW